MQISSGRGPAECEVAVGLYLEYFIKQHPETSIIEEHGGWSRKIGDRKITAYKSVILESVDGEAIETGPVKWTCPSPLRRNHNRKNWFIEVNILHNHLDKKIDRQGLNRDSPDKRIIKIETYHSPGKGGQNVNKVETGVRAVHLPTGLSCNSTTSRTQGGNKKLALDRLGNLILTHNLGLERQSLAESRRLHDQLERGNHMAAFTGIDFIPVNQR